MKDTDALNECAELLKQAVIHLRKAETIFEDLDILTYKIQGDFFSLYEFCDENVIKILKKQKNHVD